MKTNNMKKNVNDMYSNINTCTEKDKKYVIAIMKL